MVPRRVVALAAALPLVFVLSGCSPLSLFASWGDSPAPGQSASETAEAAPTPTRSAQPQPTPTPTPGCVNRVISQAGTYRVGDCVHLTVSGAGITVTAARIGTLTILGDSLKVYAQSIKVLDVQGGLNTVQTSDALGAVQLTGDRNMITSHAAITSVVVNGNDNRVTADGGIGSNVHDNGQRNTISSQP
jgi:hypothetical protein